MVPLWEKFLVLIPLANVNALTRQPLGRYRADPDTWALVEASAREAEAVGRAEGVNLPPDAVEHALATIRSMPDHHMSSMGNDLVRGNRLELPWLAGKVVQARPTPWHTDAGQRVRLRGVEAICGRRSDQTRPVKSVISGLEILTIRSAG